MAEIGLEPAVNSQQGDDAVVDKPGIGMEIFVGGDQFGQVGVDPALGKVGQLGQQSQEMMVEIVGFGEGMCQLLFTVGYGLVGGCVIGV